MAAGVQQESRHAGIMTDPLITVGMRGLHEFDLHGAVPVRRRSDSAGVRSEADQGAFAAKALTAELADVDLLPHQAHFGVTGVPDMRVMGPHYGFGLGLRI